MALIDFLKIDITDEENIPAIMSYLVDYLERLNEHEFSAKNIHKLSGIIDKFIGLSKYYNVGNTYGLREKTDKFVNLIIEHQFSGSNETSEICRTLFNEINKSAYLIYNQISNNSPSDIFFEEFKIFYNPYESDKEKAIILITEVIEILSNDNTLGDRQRNNLIKQLKKIITNLQSEKPNWSNYFGDLHQTIIILGTLGSFVSGATGVLSLMDANDKLMQATQIINNTSVNTNIEFKLSIDNQFYNYFLEETKPKTLSLPDGTEKK